LVTEEASMLRRTNIRLALVLSIAAWAAPVNAVEQKQANPKPLDKNALRAAEVKQLLLLMDTDPSGKISKEEWLKFMEAEFDRLDKAKSGKVDLKDISQSPQHVSRSANMGK
jgi:Ca2+-binding EF-hand superfamily protein